MMGLHAAQALNFASVDGVTLSEAGKSLRGAAAQREAAQTGNQLVTKHWHSERRPSSSTREACFHYNVGKNDETSGGDPPPGAPVTPE